jgi:uncharacterized protein (TIGR00299 family) protein
MILGALLGLGVDQDTLTALLRTLPIEGFKLEVSEVTRFGQGGLHVNVVVADEHHPHRGVRDIRDLIAQGELGERTRALALATFQKLAEAEASVHGTTPEAVHFHEVGAMDAIVDIVGCCACLELLDIDAVHCSALPLGTGTVEAAHGVLPLPVPATAVLLKDSAVTPTTLPFELVTPTGAALLTTWQEMLPSGVGEGGTIRVVATGFGTRELPDRPNALRAMLLESDVKNSAETAEAACRVLECNVDDMSPELVGSLYERLRSAGALDVFTTPVQMKKQRPGVLLTVLCSEDQREALLEIIFTESTTFGVREYPVSRSTLERELVPVETPYGTVHVKVGRWKGRVVTRAPEYEDCAAAAKAHGAPVKVVYEVAMKSLERVEVGSRKSEVGDQRSGGGNE